MNLGTGADGGRHTAHGSVSSVSSTPFMTPGPMLDTDMTGGSGSGYGMSPVPAAGAAAPGTGIAAGGGQRKERGAIAAQACDTCRSRKQKCDEQRPQCSTCQKFKLACHYREPQPTKKDKTLGEILDRLNTLESKIDLLSLAGGGCDGGGGGGGTSKYNNSKPDSLGDLGHLPETIPDMFHGSMPLPAAAAAAGQTGPPQPAGGYQYASATYQMLGWPAVQQLLAPLEHLGVPHVHAFAVEHTARAVTLQMHHETVAGTPACALSDAQGFLFDDFTMGASATLLPPAALPPRGGDDTLYRSSNAYFDTFNCIAPIVDRTTFFASTLPTVLEGGSAWHGHDRSSSSSHNNSGRSNSTTASNNASKVLAYLVLALGEVAMADMQGLGPGPRDAAPPQPPRPPGLFFFNKARQLMGFVLGDSSLEAVQIPALVGIYYSTCLQHMEYWRFTTMASLSCLALIKSNPSELTSPRADVIRRIFWYCLIIETHFNIELGLPLTGLDRCEHIVGLPNFSGPYSQDDYLANEASHFQEHYASQIVLCRLCAAFHTTLSSETDAAPSTPITPAAADAVHTVHAAAMPMPLSLPSSSSSYPRAAHHMALQLDDWRGMLPQHLRWADHRPFFGHHHHDSVSLVYPRPYALDLQEAVLRTRYYSTSYLVHRPFLYKALHHPDQLSHDDARGAAACLHACLRWPLTMPPASAHKRLVPCVFFTTQNVLGVLVVLRLAQQVPMLVRIKALVPAGAGAGAGETVPGASSNVNGSNNGGTTGSSLTMTPDGFDREAQETISLCVAWLRDLRGVDRAAGWAWEVVKGIYHIRE